MPYEKLDGNNILPSGANGTMLSAAPEHSFASSFPATCLLPMSAYLFGVHPIDTKYQLLPPGRWEDRGSKQVVGKLLSKLCSGVARSRAALVPLEGIWLPSEILYGNHCVSIFGSIW